MARFRIPYLVAKPRKRGGARHYWQPNAELRAAGWAPVGLPDDEAQAIQRARELNAALEARRRATGLLYPPPPAPAKAAPAAPAAAPGSVNELIWRYKTSRFFVEKRPKTKKGYDWCLQIIGQWAGDLRVTELDAEDVQDLYASLRAKTPAKANAVIRVLRLLLANAMRFGYRKDNPARSPGLVGAQPSGRLWSRDELDLVIEAADRAGRPSIGTAVLVNFWLGQRPTDIIRLRWDQFRDGGFEICQSKTGARVFVELPAEALTRLAEERARLDARKVVSTHVVVSEMTGRPYDEYHFTHSFARIRDRAAAEWPPAATLQFKHLRHTAVTELAAAGCETAEIANITGHTIKSVETILERYLVRGARLARSAQRKRMARAAEDVGK